MKHGSLVGLSIPFIVLLLLVTGLLGPVIGRLIVAFLMYHAVVWYAASRIAKGVRATEMANTVASLFALAAFFVPVVTIVALSVIGLAQHISRLTKSQAN